MGEEAEEVLQSTKPSEEQWKSYEEVISKLDSFFKVRKNTIFERARFNRRHQLEGETVEQYIVELLKLVEHCEYGTMRDEMVRDRLVVGIRDSPLSEQLQLDSTLTLESAMKRVRQREAVHENQQTLKGNPSLEEVRKGAPTQGKNRYTSRPRPSKVTSTSKPRCTRCGKEAHSRDSCPAKEATCHKCKKKGHYSSQCYSKQVSEVTIANSPNDVNYLDTLGNETEENCWRATITVNGRAVLFKIDTGAEVTAISKSTFKDLDMKELLSTDRILAGPSRQPLKVEGRFRADLKFKEEESQQSVYVIEGLKNNLLGLPAITALGLISRLHSITNIKSEIGEKYPSVFTGLGCFKEEYQIKLKEGATPHCLFTPRHVPLPLRDKVREELENMEQMKIISKVDEPTSWCAGMVVVPKKQGSLRICVDLKPLNENVLREIHPLPKVEDLLAQLAGAKVFSKLDANSGFWQIPLVKSSRLLTTFVTPFGRYCFNKLPFGISSAPEYFQKQMNKILQGVEGVICLIDDILVFGKDAQEHKTRLETVLNIIKGAGITLNLEKCEFGKTELKFLGHIIDPDGIRADPEKTRAIQEMKPPDNVSDLRRFMGMVNQLGKFSPNLAELTQPLRELLHKNRDWVWSEVQQNSFARVKDELSEPTILSLYDPHKETKVSADASCYGLGAVLMQKEKETWRPVAYASRSLTETERRYAQIEKEALASTWACEKFSQYVLGMRFLVETDHKPLVPLLGNKHLDTLPPRVLRFRLRLARFDYDIRHVPGKLLYTADTLSRAPTPHSTDDLESQEEAELLVETITSHLPASPQTLQEYREAQQTDPVCSTVRNYCRHGWPDRKPENPDLTPFWEVRGKLSVGKELLLFGSRIVVPQSLRERTLEKIHEGHQGITRCRLRAQLSVWWPKMPQDIQKLIQTGSVCVKGTHNKCEPLMPSSLPDYPWQKIGTDLFYWKNTTYIIMVDYYSRYPEVIRLDSTTTSGVIKAMKSVFSRHGVPETIFSDNGPQFSSKEFLDFAKQYDFCHVTSSPHYPQSNGLAERSIQTIKKLLTNCDDQYMGILNFRTTPLPWCNLSPAELLMGRRLRSNLPLSREQLKPQWPYLKEFTHHDHHFKLRQKRHFDKRHRVSELPPLSNNCNVWVDTEGTRVPGQVSTQDSTPRSYWVTVPSGNEVRRNRRHLIPRSDNSTTNEEDESTPNHAIVTRSRSGIPIHPPDRYCPSYY
jgi:transposase InsO family protein